MSRILVFRIGSIGDFVVSLPCFHLLREKYPNDEIVLLANEPIGDYQVPADSVLKGSGLVDRIIKYPADIRDLENLRNLRGAIQRYAPDMLVYLAPPRGPVSILRDDLFFRLACRIRHIVGLPLNPFALEPLRPAAGHTLWESEAARLARQIALLGVGALEHPESWDLHLSSREIAEGDHILAGDSSWDGGTGRRLVGLSVGTKQPINDWGDHNWEQVLRGLGQLKIGRLVLFGGAQDRERSQNIARAWPGLPLNLCGQIEPRISAAVLRRMDLLLCHDSGPMHLAASVGTRCVAVFSRRNPPGRWFPFGSNHKVLYPSSRVGAIQSILPRQVIVAAVRLLERHDALETAA
jgi:ADP-heptose:LPS heptosyltransferase